MEANEVVVILQISLRDPAKLPEETVDQSSEFRTIFAITAFSVDILPSKQRWFLSSQMNQQILCVNVSQIPLLSGGGTLFLRQTDQSKRSVAGWPRILSKLLKKFQIRLT